MTIKEVKEINKVIFNKYGLDYSNHSQTAYKNRLVELINSCNLKSSVELINIIEKGKLNLDKLLLGLSIPFTEMFRDPSMWRELRDKILPEIQGKIRIYLPSCTTGEELVSLMIILKEEGFLSRSKITVSACSKSIIEVIKVSEYTEKQMELNNANYKRYKESNNIFDYSEKSNGKYCFSELLKNVNFIESRILENTKLPTGQDIVIYRNKLIYFNMKMQNDVLNKLNNTVRAGGYFIVGTMENIFASNEVKCEFELVSKNDKLYKKRTN